MDAQMVRRGKSLPKLVNPAGPAQILDGFQALDGAGRVLTGTLTASMEKLEVPCLYAVWNDICTIDLSKKYFLLAFAVQDVRARYSMQAALVENGVLTGVNNPGYVTLQLKGNILQLAQTHSGSETVGVAFCICIVCYG